MLPCIYSLLPVWAHDPTQQSTLCQHTTLCHISDASMLCFHDRRMYAIDSQHPVSSTWASWPCTPAWCCGNSCSTGTRG